MNFERTPVSQLGQQMPIPFNGNQQQQPQHNQYAQNEFPHWGQGGRQFAPQPSRPKGRGILGFLLVLLGITLGFAIGFYFNKLKNSISGAKKNAQKPVFTPPIAINTDEQTIEEQHQEFRGLTFPHLQKPEPIGFQTAKKDEEDN